MEATGSYLLILLINLYHNEVINFTTIHLWLN